MDPADNDPDLKAAMAGLPDAAPVPKIAHAAAPVPKIAHAAAPVPKIAHAAAPEDNDPDLKAAIAGLSGSAPASSVASHQTPSPHPHAVPTQFHKAAVPAAPDEPELTWQETGRQAVSNLAPSAVGAGQAMWNAIRHPIKTAETVGQLGTGFASQAAGAMGVQQDPAEKAKAEALAKAMEDHYVTAYGSIKGFKKAVATDPIGVGMDVGSVFGVAGAAAKVAGLTKTAALLSKIDPIAAAVKVASAPVKAIARGVSSTATGVPASLMKVAAKAGATSDPALRGAFMKFYTGQGNPSEFLQTAQNALGQVRSDASSAYLAKKATLATATPSFKPIEDAIATARAETMRGGVNVGQFKAANDALDEAETMINGWKAAPDPAYQSLLGFDNLKQAIWDLRDSTGNSAAQRHLGSVYNGVKQSIVDVDPEYAKLMEQYQTARGNLNDTQRTLIGAGNNPAATLAMAKSLRALKTSTGKNLFAQLAAKEPTLPYMMAGNALHPWGAGGKTGLFEGMTSIPLAVATGAISHNPVLGAAQWAGQIAAQSPKIAGGLNYAAGAVSRLALSARGAYYAGRASEESDGAPPVPAISEPNSATDQAWSKILRQESGDSQWNKDGKPRISKAGAVGAAQVMPKTGPEAARLAGETWSLNRLANDEAYNRKLGRAYFDHLVQMFDGDLAKAAAAYNGGPTGVARAVTHSQVSGKPWLQHMPAETRAYVPNIVNAGFASGGAAKLSHEQLVDRLMKRANMAKKASNKATEPLLNMPDNTVARALDVAQQAI